MSPLERGGAIDACVPRSWTRSVPANRAGVEAM
jgi:hypothetical protein